MQYEAKWIIEFTRNTVCGCHYNAGEKAAFDPETARLLCEGGVLDEFSDNPTKVKSSAKVVRKLTAAEVEELERPQAPSVLEIDTKGMSPQKIAAIKAAAAQVSAD